MVSCVLEGLSAVVVAVKKVVVEAAEHLLVEGLCQAVEELADRDKLSNK